MPLLPPARRARRSPWLSAAAALSLAACGPELPGADAEALAASRAAVVDAAADAPDAATATAAAAAPALVITEVMANPALVNDDVGEWFEVHNPGSAPVDLEGWSLASMNDRSHLVTASVVVPAGGYVVLGASADRALNGGLPVAYGYGPGTFAFSNSGADWISLTDPSGVEVDRAAWTSSSVAAAGRSRALSNLACDNFDVAGGAWATSTAVIRGAELGTPGAPHDGPALACPAVVTYPREVRVTELMANPSGQDTLGEWFEVQNTTAEPVDLKGWTLRGNSAAETHVVATSVVVPAFGYAVLGNNADAATNGGVAVAYQYPQAFNLSNSADVIQLERPVTPGTAAPTVVVDRVSYGVSVPDGASRALFVPAAPHAGDSGGFAWATSTRPYGTGANRGSPGQGNPAPQSGADVGIDAPARLPVGYVKSARLTVRDASGGVVGWPAGLVWSSSDEAVAVVDARGYVRGTGVGVAFIRATLPDGATDAARIEVVAGESSPAIPYLSPVAFGVPTDATPEDELYLERPQFALSYSAARGGPNWVSWELSAAHFGTADRCNCFTPDPRLPAGVPLVEDADYRGGGYDRGHMVQSFNRTATEQENATTYLLSNILPQAAENNQGPWGALENHLSDLARFEGKQVYIVAGGAYPAAPATLKGEGKVAIPDYTWKVALVMDAGEGPSDVRGHEDVELVAVWMPNRVGVRGPESADGIRNRPWRDYETTVDAIEARTGYDVFALLPDAVERIVEAKDRFPTARATASATAAPEGGAVSFSGAGSTDPDVGDTLTYHWAFSDGAQAEGVSVTRAFADEGDYTATLTVTDAYGAASTATVAVSVSNVAPTLAPLPSATLLPGETFSGFGSFEDPGADSWSVTVDYGDGALAPAPLLGRLFALEHLYLVPGTWTVTVTVDDGDGGTTTGTTRVVVLTQAQAVANLESEVRARLGGATPPGALRSLLAKLEAARRQLERGAHGAAAGPLGAFVHEVEARGRTGRLAPADADALTAAAQRILRSL
jgi:endonuclease G